MTRNYLSGCSLQLASDTKISHATRVITLWLKQPVWFYNELYISMQCMIPLVMIYHALVGVKYYVTANEHFSFLSCNRL